MAKSKLKKAVMTSFQLRHRYYATDKRHQLTSQDFSFWDLTN